jgi:hypothetical protein
MTILKTYFKANSHNTKNLGVGVLSRSPSFNYISLEKDFPTDNAVLKKHMNNSFELVIQHKTPGIEELKITNQELTTWEDYWIDENSTLADPKIKSINLQKNLLSHFNANLSRPSLLKVNLESNPGLVGVVLNSPNLEYLNLSNCSSLQNITLGDNSKIKAILAKNCNLSSQAQENLLRDFKPTISSKQSDDFLMFRKTYDTVLDLRGSEVDWGNRRVASKIRLLLCNNWLVLWSNSPPTTIVPPQMYSFFASNLEDGLIKKYYLN